MLVMKTVMHFMPIIFSAFRKFEIFVKYLKDIFISIHTEVLLDGPWVFSYVV